MARLHTYNANESSISNAFEEMLNEELVASKQQLIVESNTSKLITDLCSVHKNTIAEILIERNLGKDINIAKINSLISYLEQLKSL